MKEFFYGEPGKEARGPLALDAIKVAVANGRLSSDVVLSLDGSEPWVPLNEADKLVARPKALPPAGPTPPRNTRSLPQAMHQAPGKLEPPIKSYAASGLEAMAFLSFAGAALLILMVLLSWADDKGSGVTLQYAVSSISAAAVGFLFGGAAEVLRRLREISGRLGRDRESR